MAGKNDASKRRRACVVVLGDIGRSPRMQYHAISLASQASMEVDVVAFGGSEPHKSLTENQSIHIYKMMQWPQMSPLFSKVLKPLNLLIKSLFQFIILLWHLCFKIGAPDFFLVQNPPSVPTLVAVQWASSLRKASVIIDWHNFGYTLLALSVGRNSKFVALYHWVEKHYGRKAHGALCVTSAMQHELSSNWGINATVLYDQPPDFFRSATLEEKHHLYFRINKKLYESWGVSDCISYGSEDCDFMDDTHTLFTSMINANVVLKRTRPALVVSSTSWTPDEDFSVLLEAAVMYDRRVSAFLHDNDSHDDEVWNEISLGKQYTYPRLLFIITGKGPEKEKYEEKIRRLRLKRVAFRTMWLSAEDYPVLLGSADLGVCLHTSSSGLDLPMKVVDMFGCGLPVCAASYSCIEELVKVERNGLLFASSSDLADQLMGLFKGFPDAYEPLTKLQRGALDTCASRWAGEWALHASPLIERICSRCDG